MIEMGPHKSSFTDWHHSLMQWCRKDAIRWCFLVYFLYNFQAAALIECEDLGSCVLGVRLSDCSNCGMKYHQGPVQLSSNEEYSFLLSPFIGRVVFFLAFVTLSWSHSAHQLITRKRYSLRPATKVRGSEDWTPTEELKWRSFKDLNPSMALQRPQNGLKSKAV